MVGGALAGLGHARADADGITLRADLRLLVALDFAAPLNLVIYSAPGRREWAIWDEVPGKALYTGGHIALDRVRGRIAYFREGMPTPDFHVDEKEDCYRADP